MSEEILRTASGERVYVVPQWKLRYTNPDASSKPHPMVIRVKDGHAMWGIDPEKLLTEKQWLKLRKKA
jgi:hypothetical protein